MKNGETLCECLSGIHFPVSAVSPFIILLVDLCRLTCRFALLFLWRDSSGNDSKTSLSGETISVKRDNMYRDFFSRKRRLRFLNLTQVSKSLKVLCVIVHFLQNCKFLTKFCDQGLYYLFFVF